MATGQNHGLPLAGLAIAVVGAGRIGSELIRSLASMGAGRIDVYERNHAAAEAFGGRHAVFEGDFWDRLTLARLGEYDFAVCTIDDPCARRRMNAKCLVANVNLLQAWTEGALAVAGAYPFAALPESACFECDAQRIAKPMPLATLRMTVADSATDAAHDSQIATASAAGALAASLVARIVAGAHGSVARRATLDVASGHGASLELQRDPRCPRCGGLARPIAIVQTRNRWTVAPDVAAAFPGMLDQRLQLSDEIDGLPLDGCCVGTLSARFRGGPVPAKFALTEVGGRTICLDFEDHETDGVHAATHGAGRARLPGT